MSYGIMCHQKKCQDYAAFRYLRPGKDEPMFSHGPSYTERCAAWNKWATANRVRLSKQITEALALTNAATTAAGRGGGMIPHDERIALCNRLMRDVIAPALPESERACLMIFPHSDPDGILCYMANARRPDMHKALKGLLAKWDNDAKQREGN